MKSARDMFEDVDYIQDENLSIDRYGHKLLIYRKKNNKYHAIMFDLQDKEIITDNISFEVIPAINQQVYELGWK